MRNSNRRWFSRKPGRLLVFLHGLSVRHLLLALVLLGCLFLATWARIMPAAVSLERGERADRKIVAPRTVSYVDTQETERRRQEAEDSVVIQFSSDPQAIQQAVGALNDFFDQALHVQQNPELAEEAARTKALQARIEFPISEKTLRLAVSTPEGTRQRVREGAASLLEQRMSQPLRNNAEDLEAARKKIDQAAADLGFTDRYAEMAAEIAKVALRPNWFVDLEATQDERNQAREAVEEVRGEIRAGEVVITEGGIVKQRHLDMFRALGLMNPAVDYPQAVALFALLALFVVFLFYFASHFYPDLYTRFGRLVAVCAVVAIGAFVFRLGQASPYLEAYTLTVVAASAMLVSLISAPHIGLVVAAGSALLLGLIIPEANLKPILLVFLSGAAAAYLVTLRVTRTETFVRTALAVAVFNTFILLAGTEAFGQQHSWPVLVATAAGGALAAILAIGIMLSLDRPLNLLTDLRLAELASPHQPLLQRLVREAPGTYQSSVMVGNLAEQAAEAIGANGLFVRTAALYHDIGKLKRPYFFVENQFGGENPHDKLSPFMSALILSSHARDGAEMALEANLPPQIIDLIEQHQGTELIRYFYEKAGEQAAEDVEVPEANFRYPGPKPQTKEAAVIMLADTVEAAVRTLDDPSPARVERMVNRLIHAKIEDGQLDECPLTFAQLDTIRQTLISSLNSAFHHRIKYPEQLPEEAEVQRLAEQLGPKETTAGVLPTLLGEAGQGEDESAE